MRNVFAAEWLSEVWHCWAAIGCEEGQADAGSPVYTCSEDPLDSGKRRSAFSLPV
jgi:hypothetical protein